MLSSRAVSSGPPLLVSAVHAKADVLGDRLADIADLDPDALAAITNVIDGLIAKNRLRALADDIS